MKKSLFTFTILAVIPNFANAAAPTRPQANVIYGEDNRADLYQSDSHWATLAHSTVALVKASDLKQLPNNDIEFVLDKYSEQYRLCSSERFFEQETLAFCSGSLVGQNLILTAGHCINENSCSSTRFVFDFAIFSEGVLPKSTIKNKIYSCKKIVSHSYTKTLDYALVELDRNVTDRAPLSISRNPTKVNENMTVIGHPSGLPTKVSGGANVRSVLADYYTANLDTYGGNSGSAVINKNGQVTGVLVRGEQDYVYDGANKCYKSHVCTDEGCMGEEVTRADVIADKIPLL